MSSCLEHSSFHKDQTTLQPPQPHVFQRWEEGPICVYLPSLSGS